jgi:hypothetical protein
VLASGKTENRRKRLEKPAKNLLFGFWAQIVAFCWDQSAEGFAFLSRGKRRRSGTRSFLATRAKDAKNHGEQAVAVFSAKKLVNSAFFGDFGFLPC